MPEMLGTLIGRDTELGQIDEFLNRASGGLTTLLVDGEAGIGKSSLWREAVRRARAAGFQVLACRAAASETALSHAAVADLLDELPSSAWDDLPAPQRAALDVVTLRAPPGPHPVEPSAISAGVRSLVASLSRETPVLLAIDDVQWLDDASVGVLDHAVRRLRPNRVGILAARRTSEPARLDIEALVPDDTVAHVHLEPLSFGAVRILLRDRLDAELGRSLQWRVYRAAQGNPLFALEIGRAVLERGAPGPDQPLPVPPDVHALVRQRVAALPAVATPLLLGAALLAVPSAAVLRRALDSEADDAIAAARAAGIADLQDDLVVFDHPLYAAAVVAAASAEQRRRMHQQLAGAVPSLEHRALHGWFAADGPDSDTADALERAAELAVGRGAPRDAAEAFDRAQQVTPSEQQSGKSTRGLRAAELYLDGGDRESAIALLDVLSSTDSLGPAQVAEVLRLRALIAWQDNDPTQAEQLLEQAVTQDPGSVHARVDQVLLVADEGDYRKCMALADRLVDDLDEASEGSALAEVLANRAMARCVAGEGIDWVGIRRAVELERPGASSLTGISARTVLAYLTLYAGKYDEARQLLTAVRDDLAERGVQDGYIQDWLAGLELRCGNFVGAAAHLDEGIAYTEVTGNDNMRSLFVATRKFVDIHLGDLATAQQQLDAMADDPGQVWSANTTWRARTAAVAGLAIGDYDVAWEACRTLIEEVEASGVFEPNKLLYVPDAIEALVGTGQLERAASLIELWETRARALDYEWALGFSARGRSLLALAQRDLPTASPAAQEAVDLHGRAGMQFERARNLLVLGTAERRLRHSKAARAALEEAVAEFERLETPLWAGKARDELERTAGGPRSADGVLTPSEARVAGLAVDGHANKEIAALLSVSVYTVDRHLSNVYRKLGISRRAQLPGVLPDRD